MRKSAVVVTPCAAKVAIGLALLLAAACTDMGPTPDLGGSSPFPPPPPKPSPPAAAPSAVPGTIRGRAPVFAERGDVHRVRAGETVYDVARQYGVDTYALVSHNHLSPPFELVEGQRLSIPGRGANAPAVAAASPPIGEQPTARPVPRPAAPEVAAAPAVPHPTPELATPPAGSRSAPEAAPAPSETRTAAAVPRPVESPRTAEPSPPAPSGGGFVWPVDGRIISEFGPKGGGRFNDGINIAAPEGTAVRAADGGTVAYAGNELRGFGSMLLIKHPGGWVTAYAHNQDLLVRRGDSVSRGQTIARVGSSGGVGQPQLHFELRKGKKAVDPLDYLRRPSASASGSRDSG